MRRGRRLGVVGTIVGVALLFGVAFLPSTSLTGLAGARPAAATPSTSGYPVVFTETGLPGNTNWSVTIGSTTVNSTSPTIRFTEPDGTYAFFVGPVAGYTTGPEGNVTVAGGPAALTIEFTSTAVGPSCPSFFWTGANNTLSGNCAGGFEADYRSYNATTGYTVDNTTFSVGPFAEVTPSGTVVALGGGATPGLLGSGSVTVQSTPDEINVSDVIAGHVTNAVGINSSTGDPNGATPRWTPAQLPGSGGPSTWGNGDQLLGNITVGIVFHFENGSANGTPRLKFDVAVSGWPWVNSGDVLGLTVESSAAAFPGGTHFVYTATNETISQVWNVTGAAVSSLAFGPTASTIEGPATTLQVSDQVRLSPSGASPTFAGALLTFSGAGGYPGMAYDPWVEFGPHAAIPIPPVPTPSAGGTSTVAIIAAVGGASAGGVLLGVYAQRARRRPIEDGLRSAG